VRQIKPDWVILRAGRDESDRAESSAKIGFPRDHIIGVWCRARKKT